MKNELKKYTALGLTLIIVMAVSILIYFTIGNYETLASIVKNAKNILSPFIYGAIIAYILVPMCNFYERKLAKIVKKISASEKVYKYFVREFAILLAYATIGFLLYLFFKMILPDIIESVKQIVNIVPVWINSLFEFYLHTVDKYPDLGKYLNDYANTLYLEANELVQNGLFNNIKVVISEVSVRAFGFANSMLDIVVAFIVSVYLLSGRKKFKAQGKKLVYALFKKEWAENIIQEIRFADVSFGGFIIGKIIDSAIIGFIALVALNIMKMPYASLIALIIGVTNIIPFFGPFIGAVPGAILVLFTSPIQAVYFIIFVFVLQQFDGNILGPKILGDKVGIPSIWVLFSILVFGSLWGVFGMIVGVPLFAVIMDIISKAINVKLRGKNLSTDTEDYMSNSN